jgi:hypothetical protein
MQASLFDKAGRNFVRPVANEVNNFFQKGLSGLCGCAKIQPLEKGRLDRNST